MTDDTTAGSSHLAVIEEARKRDNIRIERGKRRDQGARYCDMIKGDLQADSCNMITREVAFALKDLVGEAISHQAPDEPVRPEVLEDLHNLLKFGNPAGRSETTLLEAMADGGYPIGREALRKAMRELVNRGEAEEVEVGFWRWRYPEPAEGGDEAPSAGG